MPRYPIHGLNKEENAPETGRTTTLWAGIWWSSHLIFRSENWSLLKRLPELSKICRTIFFGKARTYWAAPLTRRGPEEDISRSSCCNGVLAGTERSYEADYAVRVQYHLGCQVKSQSDRDVEY